MKNDDKTLFENPLEEEEKEQRPSFWSKITLPKFDFGTAPTQPHLPRKRPPPPPPQPKACPKCGTHDCISSEEYKKQIDYRTLSVPSGVLTKTCKFRQQLKHARLITTFDKRLGGLSDTKEKAINKLMSLEVLNDEQIEDMRERLDEEMSKRFTGSRGPG